MAPHSAVYQFRYDHLLEAFIAKISRAQRTDYLDNNAPLRTRHFRGFRITSSVPTRQQILSAFKQEFVTGTDGALATFSALSGFVNSQRSLSSH